MKGLWILPSRRRLEKLQKFFDAATQNGMTTPGAVLVQKDELAELRLAYDGLHMPANWKIVPTNSDGMGDKSREVWPSVSKLDWVGIACDDLRPQTPGWDTTLLAKIDGTNVVTCDDGQQHDLRMSGITIFSGGLLRAMGYMHPPGFWHTYVDDVWETIGREAGCWTYEGSVLVTHDHPFVNQQIDPAKADETTNKSYGRMQEDARAFKLWSGAEKAAVIARVKALKDTAGGGTL